MLLAYVTNSPWTHCQHNGTVGICPFHRAAFGLRVRELRIGRGWSQEVFAHRAKLDRTYVSSIERGRRNPTLDIIQRIADTLEVPTADLLAVPRVLGVGAGVSGVSCGELNPARRAPNY